MSSPNDSGNEWLSIDYLLLSLCIPHAKLATAIESYGIQVYDRFDRRIPATDHDSSVKTSKNRILDLIALNYEVFQSDYYDSATWGDSRPELLSFGWPKDEVPNFEKINIEPIPASIKKQTNFDTDVAAKKHRSYLIVIESLLRILKKKNDDRNLTSLILRKAHEFAPQTEDDTVKKILKDIPRMLESLQT